ncbi:MAG TPA: PaeR7I family type II restriction endonuclease [Terriglobales bacterium]|nr:PaeR7I family type II restriction endonuclease [Terriglobales bacterium]
MNLERGLSKAVAHYGKTRSFQAANQGKGGNQDYKERASVTGGKQMDGFTHVLCDVIEQAGLHRTEIFRGKSIGEIPGFYRPTKNWDTIIVADGKLVALIELKSQMGPSFGNNFNNRVEEALGNATDVWKAYAEKTFASSPRPWLGYLMLLEDCPESRGVKKVCEPHFPVRPEFRDERYAPGNHLAVSYAKRYELFCRKMMLDRLYDSACLILSPRSQGMRGRFSEPATDLTFKAFAASLAGKAAEHVAKREFK